MASGRAGRVAVPAERRGLPVLAVAGHVGEAAVVEGAGDDARQVVVVGTVGCAATNPGEYLQLQSFRGIRAMR